MFMQGHGVVGDLSNSESVAAAVNDAAARLGGGIDILVLSDGCALGT